VDVSASHLREVRNTSNLNLADFELQREACARADCRFGSGDGFIRAFSFHALIRLFNPSRQAWSAGIPACFFWRNNQAGRDACAPGAAVEKR